ncbi:hypothetical protein BG015_002598, partial [Linnemannia schmuckeri]
VAADVRITGWYGGELTVPGDPWAPQSGNRVSILMLVDLGVGDAVIIVALAI